ncbi:MAG: hypothetical protein J6D44_14240 [Pseudomonas sp.]|nr:hypothetical protein [Pseudomonas sp.]
MAVQQFTLYMHITTHGYGKGDIQILPFDASTSSHITDKKLIKKFSVGVDVPEFNLETLEIEGLEEELRKDRAESQSRQNILIDRISKLKAIGHEE